MLRLQGCSLVTGGAIATVTNGGRIVAADSTLRSAGVGGAAAAAVVEAHSVVLLLRCVLLPPLCAAYCRGTLSATNCVVTCDRRRTSEVAGIMPNPERTLAYSCHGGKQR